MSTNPPRPELSLTSPETLSRSLLEAIDTGFCIIEMKFDHHGQPVDYCFIDMNPAFEQQTGLSNATGRWIKDLVPNHEQYWFDLYGNVALTGEPQRFEKAAEGLGRWYEVHAMRIGSPQAPKVAIFFNDISERRRAELALKALAASLEQEVAARTEARNQLWNLSSDLMLHCKSDGTVLALNPAWTETLGWTEADLLGTRILDLVHPDDLQYTLETAHKAVGGPGLKRFENRYRCRDGTYRWINWSSSYANQITNAVGRDCTAEKEQAQALAKAEAQLRQSQKMEAVGQLSGGLAHDFNNLLMGISGSLELLQARLQQGRHNDLERYINAAHSASRRAAALTHRLLAFSRRQTLDPRATNVNRLVQDMADLVQRTVGPSVELETRSAPDLWLTRVDQNQLENSLLNLCINARDAMPDGGRLIVETANCSLSATAAQTLDLSPGDYVRLRVTDNGTGMSEELMSKVFDPFFTTKPLGTGTGLGLSMVYGFALQSAGQVRLSSRVDQGSTVCLYLPRHLARDEEQEACVALPPVPRKNTGQTVLVVDDEPGVRMLVAELLEDLGYAVIEASDGRTGLNILQSGVQLDLLVTDVGLPGGMNGRQLADAAREGRPDLKVLFITGYAAHAVIGDGDLEPGMHVMTKPFAMEALAARIQELINGA